MTAFSDVLGNAMRRAGMNQVQLAQSMRISISSVSLWTNGHVVPRWENIERLADILQWDGLLRAGANERTTNCLECGKPTLSLKNKRRRFCSARCAGRVSARLLRRSDNERELVIVRGDADRHHSAVAAFCLLCEPEGVCHDAKCPLRPVSPVPLGVHPA